MRAAILAGIVAVFAVRYPDASRWLMIILICFEPELQATTQGESLIFVFICMVLLFPMLFTLCLNQIRSDRGERIG